MFLVGLAAIEIFAVTHVGSRRLSVLSIAAVSLLLLAAGALWFFGYRAYRDLTPIAVDRYAFTGIVSLFVIGALLSYGTVVGTGWLLLLWSGQLLAGRRFLPVRLTKTLLPARLWTRTTVIAAIVGVLCVLLMPVAIDLGLVPLVVLVLAGRIVAPFVFGFALRLRPGSSRIF